MLTNAKLRTVLLFADLNPLSSDLPGELRRWSDLVQRWTG